MWDKEWVWSKRFLEDRLREAARQHLTDQAIRARVERERVLIRRRPHMASRAVVWVGKRLVEWGARIQARYGEASEPQALQWGREQR